MSDTLQTMLDKLTSLFKTTDEVLSDWSGSKSEGNLQFPVLLGMIAVKLNWDEKQLRENDPIVRYYVRNNPDWYVTRGAHGGIMRSTDKQNKEAAKQAKEAVKAQLQAVIDAKTSANVSDVTTDDADSDTGTSVN